MYAIYTVAAMYSMTALHTMTGSYGIRAMHAKKTEIPKGFS